ncbi:hypothetical protein ACM66B_006026 [Microbotryomycetes sp. NB124-2]
MEPEVLQAIYHEKQERGSMLCAQHALNNLFQEPTYQADDLATLARQLDQLERAQLDDDERTAAFRQTNGQSHNYDDSGFFSVGVLESALDVYGLRLVRWQSRELRDRHDQPEQMQAFILNHAQHWYTIRRFVSQDRFYNLDSCAPEPQWISSTMLGLTLYEAERAGYNVFVVLPSNESRVTGLPPCQADEVINKMPKVLVPKVSISGASINGTSIAFSGAGNKLGTTSSSSKSSTSTNPGHAPVASTSKVVQASGPVASTSASASTAAQKSNGGGGSSSSSSSTGRHKRQPSLTPLSIDSSDVEDDDDDVIIVGSTASTSRSNGVDHSRNGSTSHARKKRMTRHPDLLKDRNESPAFLEPEVDRKHSLSNGIENGTTAEDEDDQMARAIAESLKMSKESLETGTSKQGHIKSSKSKGTREEEDDEELQRALKASLDLTSSGGQEEEEEEEEQADGVAADDSPTMDELRQRRLARFGA